MIKTILLAHVIAALFSVPVILIKIAIEGNWKRVSGWIKVLSTVPPWHRYTGPSRRSMDFSANPVTWLDGISFFHDQDVESSTVVFTFKNTASQSYGNVVADLKFIGRWSLGVLSLGLYPIYKNYVMAMDGALVDNDIKRYIYAVGNSVLDLLVGWFGATIFTLNIALNLINIFIKVPSTTVKLLVTTIWNKLFKK